MEFQDSMRSLEDHIYMEHPLLYDQHGVAADEETSYAWACVKFARDVTSHQPHETYVQRAQKAFKDRWMVAPRRRAQDPAMSPFWPMDQDFFRGFQSDLPWLQDKEFQRQDERMISMSRQFIKKAKEEMKIARERGHRPRISSHTINRPMSMRESSPPVLLTDFSSNESTPSSHGSEPHELEPEDFPVRNELPPLQIRSRYRDESPPQTLPSLRVLLHFRHISNESTGRGY